VSWRALREARRYVAGALVADVILALWGRSRRAGWLSAGTTLAGLLFFRDPERPLQAQADTVYASADGVIVGVDEIEDEWMAGPALRLSTFLSLHNVHVIRSPLGGRVAAEEQIDGGFAPAFLGRRSGANLRRRLLIDAGRDEVVLVQIAGMLARKITSWTHVDAGVSAGQRVGLIHLGSRTEIMVPAARYEALVKPGQRVRAGVTPVARCVHGGAES
jgi:phosphatidylserine decarboxylase